jgi:hypothetical protein
MMALAYLKPIEVLAAAKPHGTRLRYMAGCKCVPCRAANSRYETRRAELRRCGLANGIVDAGRVRGRLRSLSRGGIGYKTAARNAGVSRTTLAMVKSGRRRNVRAMTEKRVLELGDRGGHADGAIVPARKTWRQIDRLLEEGFSKTALARRLGVGKAIQFQRDRVLMSTARKVDRLYRELMRGGDTPC